MSTSESYESSIIPPRKTAFKILAARWFYYRELLLLKKHERSEFIVAFGGFGACLPEQDHRWEFITVVKKYPLCMLAYFFLNL